MTGRRCVFIDRDDTIAKNVPYCDSPDKFHLFPGVPEQIKRLNDAGYLVIVITNQSGIGRGLFTLETLNKIHEKMVHEIEASGGHVDDIYFCPHRPDENCQCRKPNTQMGDKAIEKYGIDVTKTYMIGDSEADMEFGRKLGCTSIRVDDTFRFSDAVDLILKNISESVCTR